MAQEANEAHSIATIGVTEVLLRQQAAWNRGDLDALLATYAEDSTVRYSTGTESVHGIEAIRNRFRTAYPDQGELGTLRYHDVEITPIGGDHAIVFGRARVEGFRGANAPFESLFTLQLQRTTDGWRVVTDHTST